jgi:hypothetical protein
MSRDYERNKTKNLASPKKWNKVLVRVSRLSDYSMLTKFGTVGGMFQSSHCHFRYKSVVEVEIWPSSRGFPSELGHSSLLQRLWYLEGNDLTGTCLFSAQSIFRQ